MSRRVSQRKRIDFSELVRSADIKEHDVLCDSKIYKGDGPRKLIYRRLKGIELTFDGYWPQTTSIYCWYCRMGFSSVPIPIVQQYDAVKDQYDVYGITCSPQCSKSYLSSFRSNDAQTRLMWQKKMLVEVFGWPIHVPIPFAKPWQELSIFGGNLSLEQWKQYNPCENIRIQKPPFVPFYIFSETEIKEGKAGVCLIDETHNHPVPEVADTLEEQAIQHGAAFSLKGLKRPDEDKIIRTIDQLRSAHPRHKIDANAMEGGIFDEFLKTTQLPTEEECQQIRDQREADRKAKRKRKNAPL